MLGVLHYIGPSSLSCIKSLQFPIARFTDIHMALMTLEDMGARVQNGGPELDCLNIEVLRSNDASEDGGYRDSHVTARYEELWRKLREFKDVAVVRLGFNPEVKFYCGLEDLAASSKEAWAQNSLVILAKAWLTFA
jgi:hypothetical protein